MKHSNNTSDGIKTTSFLDRVWPSIEEMPIYNWIKTLETGRLEWIFREGKGRVTKKIAEHWLNLQQQYIDEFGLDENFKQRIRLQKKLIALNLEFVETRDRFLLNVIRMTEADLETQGQEKAIKFYQILDHVEKYKGFAIDPHKTSVIKWYYSLKNMTSSGKEDTRN